MTDIKMVIVGSNNVGKSAIKNQFISHQFGDDLPIEGSYRKQVDIDEELYNFDLLDTSNQDDYSKWREMYFEESLGFILCYAINSRISFSEMSIYRDRVIQSKKGVVPLMILCGNKCDLEESREISKVEAQELARQWSINCIECSAKCRTNIDEIFFELVREIKRNGLIVPTPVNNRRCILC